MLRDIEQDILKGGRFVTYHWCLSILVMTFSRVSSVRYVRSWKSGAGRAWFYSSLSMLLGWWGFPFGLVFTPICLWKNGRGGSDVTAEFLTQVLGPVRTQSILAKATPRKLDPLLWLLLVFSLSLPLLAFGTFFYFIVSDK